MTIFSTKDASSSFFFWTSSSFSLRLGAWTAPGPHGAKPSCAANWLVLQLGVPISLLLMRPGAVCNLRPALRKSTILARVGKEGVIRIWYDPNGLP